VKEPHRPTSVMASSVARFVTRDKDKCVAAAVCIKAVCLRSLHQGRVLAPSHTRVLACVVCRIVAEAMQTLDYGAERFGTIREYVDKTQMLYSGVGKSVPR
jgi:hypothetical protein